MKEAASATSGLSRLTAVVQEILSDVDAGPVVPAPTMRSLGEVLREALADQDLLPEEVVSGPPPPVTGLWKYLLHRSDRFVIFTIVTGPKFSIPAHDHGGWGLVGVYRGIEEEVQYIPTDLGVDQGLVCLAEMRRLVHKPGDVTTIRPPVPDIHQVTNLGDENSITIHLFGHDVLAKGFRSYVPAFLPMSSGDTDYDPLPGVVALSPGG